jgi:hypothetical protein
MKTHDRVAELLKSSRVLHSLGLSDIWYAAKRANHHDLIVISKASWRLPCSDADCGYESVYVHFEYERPGFLLLHCELYPRQGSEAKHPRERIQPLLELKGEIATLIREAATDDGWIGSIGWEVSGKDLSEPKNLQVGKFSLGSVSDNPEFITNAIERVVQVVVPTIDPIMSES